MGLGLKTGSLVIFASEGSHSFIRGLRWNVMWAGTDVYSSDEGALGLHIVIVPCHRV